MICIILLRYYVNIIFYNIVLERMRENEGEIERDTEIETEAKTERKD